MKLQQMRKDMKIRSLSILLAVMFAWTSMPVSAPALQARVKDISRIAGLESMELIGYGIVVGLTGSGDKDLLITKQTVANLMENFNITISRDDIKSKNVAAVTVTATVRPFHKEGDRLDVKVSSMGDAVSLEGGILLMTPMLSPNGDIYAMAQGSVTLGGFSAGDAGAAGGSSVAKNHTTTGIVPNGGLLKESDDPVFMENGALRILLRHPDFTTANRMTQAINSKFGGIAVAKDASTVIVQIPQDSIQVGQTASFIAGLEIVSVEPDIQARVVINERTGTIVMGGNVNISEAVVAHGNLTVTIKETLHPSHPSNFFLELEEAVSPDIRSLETPDVVTTVEEESAKVLLIPRTTTVQELADTLNLMGTTPRDLISILEALHRLGAIQMELVAM